MSFLNRVSRRFKKSMHTRKHVKGKESTDGDESIFQPRTKEPNFFLSVIVTTMKMFLVLFVIVAVSGAGAILGIAKAYVETTPTLDVGKIEDQAQTSFIYDAEGNLITDFSSTENRVWATIDEIPKQLQDAFIAVEDVRFRSHQGVDIKRLFGAFVNNLKNESVQGGSTITQQLIKNTMLSPEQTYKRKIQEAYLSLELEKHYTKDQILEAYLNTIHLGGSNYGVKAAAKDYFNKELDELTLMECATLAGITKNPYLYDPRKNLYDSNRNEEITYNRSKLVLYEMYENGFITKKEYEKAKNEKLHVEKESKHRQLYEMPYFVEYAIYDVITHMLKFRNMEDTKQNRSIIENELRTKGYHIYTTVDPEIQKTVEESLSKWKNYPKLKNSKDSVIKTPDGREIPQPQASAVVFDYHTGQLKAIVGGRIAPEQKKELNRAFQANMPVGSSIKPIAVYGPAIDKGASPATVQYNLPLKIDGWGGRGYPNNYGGGGFSGPITLREALVRSLNVVSARTLFDIVKVEDSVNYLVSLGINPNHINKDGPGLSLGTSGITIIEMAVAYGAIGNEGVYQEPISFTKVLDSNGEVILDATENQVKRKVFKPSTAWILVDMMQDAVARGTGTRARIKGMNVAGKTGTNSDYRGVFFAGITPYYSAAVWVGHDSYKPLYTGAQGGRDAAPLWQDFMSKIHEGLKNKPIIDKEPRELGLVKKTVCSVSGLLATPECQTDLGGRKPVTDWFLKGTEPKKECDMHRKLVVCTESKAIAGPYCPEELKTSSSVILIPEESPLRQLSQSQLTKYLPGAYLSLPDSIDLSTMDPSNEKNAKILCPIHTKEWYDQEQLRQAAIQEATQLIKNVQQRKLQLQNKLTQNQMNEIDAKILALQKLIPNGELVDIQNAIEQLRQVSNKHFTAAEQKPDSSNPPPTSDNGNGDNTENQD